MAERVDMPLGQAGYNPSGSFSRRAEKAFDFAQDCAKQMLTLATGIIAVTITLFNSFAAHAPGGAKIFLSISWIMYLISAAFGVWTLLALTGTLARPAPDPEASSIYGSNIRSPAIIQLAFFLLGLACSVGGGAWIWA
jgi:hypothetical protein